LFWWIVVAVVVVGLGVYAFWPRRSGVDNEVWRSRQLDKGRAENYNNTSGPNFGGPL
jgi:hypothetical protein